VQDHPEESDAEDSHAEGAYLSETNANSAFARSQHQRGLSRPQIAREIMIHKELNHVNVVKMHHYFEDNLNVYMLLEACPRKVSRVSSDRFASLSFLATCSRRVQRFRNSIYFASQTCPWADASWKLFRPLNARVDVPPESERQLDRLLQLFASCVTYLLLFLVIPCSLAARPRTRSEMINPFGRRGRL